MSYNKNEKIIANLKSILDKYEAYQRPDSFSDPIAGEYFNSQYKQLTGKDHPNYVRSHIFFCEEFIKNENERIYDFIYGRTKNDPDVEATVEAINIVKGMLKEIATTHENLIPEYRKVLLNYGETSPKLMQSIIEYKYGVPPEKQINLEDYVAQHSRKIKL